jgi:hypothetical protein
MLTEERLYLQTVFRNVLGRFVLFIGYFGGGFHGNISNLGLYRVEW